MPSAFSCVAGRGICACVLLFAVVAKSEAAKLRGDLRGVELNFTRGFAAREYSRGSQGKKKRRLNPPEDMKLKQIFFQLQGSFVKYCFYNFSIKFLSFRRPVTV